MSFDEAAKAAQATVDAQSAKVLESAKALVEAAGPALVEFATQGVRNLVKDDHEQTSKHQADGTLSEFKSEVLDLIRGLPAEVDAVFAGGSHLVYTHQLSIDAFNAIGVSSDNKAVIRTGCNKALAKVNYFIEDWYPHNSKIGLLRTSTLDFPKSFQEAITQQYQTYQTQQKELQRVTRLLEEAEAELSKANAASAWDNA